MRAMLREPGVSLRWFFLGLAAICIAAAVIFRVEVGPPLDPVFFMGAALLFLAPIFRRRPTFYEVELTAQPGHLLAESRDRFGRKHEHRIALRDVTGASTARVEDRVSLALALGSRKREPITLTFASEADLTTALNALGIGRAGFGVLSWDRGPRPIHIVSAALRVAATFGCFVVCLLARIHDSFAATLDTTSLSTMMVVGTAAFVTLLPFVIAKRSISLLSSGLHTFEERVRFYPYADIAAIRLKTRAFKLDVIRRGSRKDLERIETVSIPFVALSPFLSGLDAVDIAIILEQVTSASARARHPDAASEHVEQVRQLVSRHKGESNETWVRRIDALADSWRASPPRHGESVSYRHALWQAVEDHDCETELRVLSARMLARLDPDVAPPKLRVLTNAIRDPQTASRMRIALESDVEPIAKSMPPISKR